MANLENIRIVLVRTFHPGNIGSAARSMKTMGLSKLHLVEPKDFPSEQATQMAASADDLLSSATIHSSIFSAVASCDVVIASTARPRGYDLPKLSPEQAAELLLKVSESSNVALLFGPERMGLHNDDLKHARHRVTINANPAYSSLNMAAAVQTLCYEIYKKFSSHQHIAPETVKQPVDLPTTEEIELLHQHLEKVLRKIQFLRPHEGETLLRLRHFVNKAEIDKVELNILRGILNRVEQSIQIQQ